MAFSFSTVTVVSSVTSRLAHSAATRLAGLMLRRSRVRLRPSRSLKGTLYHSSSPLYQSNQLWMWVSMLVSMVYPRSFSFLFTCSGTLNSSIATV